MSIIIHKKILQIDRWRPPYSFAALNASNVLVHFRKRILWKQRFVCGPLSANIFFWEKMFIYLYIFYVSKNWTFCVQLCRWNQIYTNKSETGLFSRKPGHWLSYIHPCRGPSRLLDSPPPLGTLQIRPLSLSSMSPNFHICYVQ